VALLLTPYYQTHLAKLHGHLIDHAITRKYLSGADIRLDGEQLRPEDHFTLPSGIGVSTLEFAHLFSVFDGSRVRKQAEKAPSRDEAPPGMYFTVVNNKLIQNQHKNKSGLFEEVTGTPGLFIKGLHVDHFYLNEKVSPEGLGSISFALCAITAHLAKLGKISLIAAGGVGYDLRHIGFKVWPRLGFNARLLPDETKNARHLHQCQTVLDVLAIDNEWWDKHGSQRLMTFELNPDSASWRKLISYLSEKVFVGVPYA
jgi:hypothetical protein